MHSSFQLPACLSHSTLGDVLGCLHRSAVSGVLQLIPFGTATPDEVELRHGLVVRVTLAQPAGRLGDVLRQQADVPPHFERALGLALARSKDRRPLGERLVAAGVVPRQQLSPMVQDLHRRRLDVLFERTQGALRFRLLCRPTVSTLVLEPPSFLYNRRRYRDVRKPVVEAQSSAVFQAYRVLGLEPGAPLMQVKLAYKRLAAMWHPDRFEHQGQVSVERAARRFRECATSYRVLCAEAQ